MKHIQKAYIKSSFAEGINMVLDFNTVLEYLMKYETIGTNYNTILNHTKDLIKEKSELGFRDIEFREEIIFVRGFLLKHKVSWDDDRKTLYLDGYIDGNYQVHFREYSRYLRHLNLTEHTSLDGYDINKNLIDTYRSFVNIRDEFHQREKLLTEVEELKQTISQLQEEILNLKQRS